MRASEGHPLGGPGRLNTYAAYSIGCAVAWAVVWAIFAITTKADRDQLLVFFIGWLVGWGSATLARVVYAPPKKRESAGPTSFFQGFRET
jgi:hypothetical protein